MENIGDEEKTASGRDTLQIKNGGSTRRLEDT
jgi:hypothetical protein